MGTATVRKALDNIRAELDAIERALDDDRPPMQVPGQGQWRFSMLETLLQHVEHLPGVMHMLDLAAERSPDAITIDEVRAASRLDRRQQANEHARLSRVTKELFGKTTWPVQAWQEARDGKMHYRMGTTVAEWWHELRRR